MLRFDAMLRRSVLVSSLAFAFPVLGATASAHAAGTTGGTSPAPASPLASAQAAADGSEYPRAETELAAIGGSDRPLAQLALARVRFEQGKYAEAEKASQAAGNDGRTKGYAIALRAEVLLATGKTGEAVRLLEGAHAVTGPASRRIALLLGEAKIATGHRADGESSLMTIVQAYNDNTIGSQDAEGLALVGRAAHLLRSPKDANTAFNESERAGGKKPETLAWRADLYLEKYDPGHAEEVLRDALAVAPHRADLLVRMARVKLEQALDFEAADKLIADALVVNPKSTGAQAVKASIALHDMNLTASDAALDAGLATNPHDLELLSLKAATRFLADDKPGYEAAKRKVFAENAEFSRFYGIVGELAEWEHRYDDIVQMMKEAVKIDGEDGKAWADLGLTEMRNGAETEGLEALRHAWSQDHFNVRVFNTLNLYEQTIPSHYQTDTDGLFKIRYPKDEEPILKRYVPRLLGEAFGDMKKRYGFTPQLTGAGGAVRQPRAVQRAHERLAQHRHPGSVLRARGGGDGAGERAVQLGQRGVARAGARLCYPTVQVSRAALVHRGAQRVRDDRAAAGVATRARSRAVPGDQERQAARRRRHEPRLHPRLRRQRRDGGVLRGQPDDGLHGGDVRHAEGGGGAESLGAGADDGAGDPEGIRSVAGGLRRALQDVAAGQAVALQRAVPLRRSTAEGGRRQGQGDAPAERRRRARGIRLRAAGEPAREGGEGGATFSQRW